jgi:protein-S-isoprenylcysteine O-methyltransferase Ste14
MKAWRRIPTKRSRSGSRLRSLWLFGRHQTGLLPGQATVVLIEEGPFRRFLRERCGAQYDDYTRRVRRWL